MQDELTRLNEEFTALIAEQERAAGSEEKSRLHLEGQDLEMWGGHGDPEKYGKAVDAWRDAKRAMDEISRRLADNARARQRLMKAYAVQV